MQIARTTDVGQVLIVATSITVGVGIINERSRMQRLMDITNVVNDQAEGERSCVFLIWEVVLDTGVVEA